MPFIHNISTVARYEARTLRRSWFFRLFSIGALFIFIFMNIGVFSPIGEEDWDLISIPSSIPLINLYLLNIGQAIVVIFLAADFLKRDKKLDTNEVLYTRSMSNFEYITGKTWGILRLFLGLDVIILSIGLLMNVISARMTVDIMSYIWYLLIIAVPTIVFSLGLAFMMMSAIKNQAITFLLLLGTAALDMFYMWFRMGSLFDYMAFGLPVFKSTIVGFDNLDVIINQRLLYFCLGMSLVMGTVLLFKRLPQEKFHTVITVILLIAFFCGAVVTGFNTYSFYSEGVRVKNSIIETSAKFENISFCDITDEDIEVGHNGQSIDATAKITILNNNSERLDKYIFSLNPSLDVLSVTSGGRDLKFTRTNHILEVDPGKFLEAGEKDSLRIAYAGKINESFCYPHFSDNIKENPYRIAMVNVNKRQAFLQKNFVLLTPETHWYPVATLNYYPSNPARIKLDFTKFTLRVKDEAGMIPVSQGPSRSSDGYRVFSPENPLTGITLGIGNYKTDTLKVDSVEYIAYYLPGHDYYKKDLAEIKDTLTSMISGIMRELETNFSTRYPFRSLSLVEVPVQFHSYPRESTQTRAEVQPSMILLPEKLSTLNNAGFGKQFTQQKKRMARNNQVITDKELQVRLLNSFIRNTFISGENTRWQNGQPVNEPVRYRLGPSFYFFKNNFYSSEYPAINAVFESHLQKISQPAPPGGYQDWYGRVAENDRANLVLRNYSFNELLQKNPQGDTVRNVLTVKGDWFFNFLRSKAGIDEFKSWFSEYLDKNNFRKVDILKFNTDVQQKFGFAFYPYLEKWFYGKEQPGFIINNLRVSEIVVSDRSRYQVSFTAVNPEHVAGLFNVSFRTGGQGRGAGSGQGTNFGEGGSTQGRGMDVTDITRVIFLDSLEAKRIGILLDFQPRAMMINTLFSKNIPGQITIPVDEIIKSKGTVVPFEGEENLATLPVLTDPAEIIVDNEDPGFNAGARSAASPLRKILGIHGSEGLTYESVRVWGVPEYWQPVIQSSYYGKYILSSVYTRSGTGDKSVRWTAAISKPGYYDVYCYIGKTIDRMMVRRGGSDPEGPRQGDNPYKDMHYKIYHDQGVDEITVDYENADGGWSNLGRFYFSSDSAKVEMTNKSQGRVVIADAVKWVRQE